MEGSDKPRERYPKGAETHARFLSERIPTSRWIWHGSETNERPGNDRGSALCVTQMREFLPQRNWALDIKDANAALKKRNQEILDAESLVAMKHARNTCCCPSDFSVWAAVAAAGLQRGSDGTKSWID